MNLLIQNDIVDIVVAPEAHVDVNGARRIEDYASQHGMKAYVAPTSAPAAAMEL